jgi:ATP-dependent Clp protease ATP-binding subunit ClpA
MRSLIDRLNSLSDLLKANIIGQDKPLEDIVELLQGSMLGMRYKDQPVATMLLLGPTGVGKTSAVLLFNDLLFGNRSKLIRFNMQDYQVQGSLEKLIGSKVGERGLFGYHYDVSGGSGTILFDEIEKAHPLVLDVLLQVLDCGHFDLATGETLDLTRYVIAGTSNIGGRELMETDCTDYHTVARRVEGAATEGLRPEFIARWDLVTALNKLDHKAQSQIAQLHMGKALAVINGEGHQIELGEGVLGHIQSEGMSKTKGARSMKKKALAILRKPVKDAVLINGGATVTGTIKYDMPNDRCFLVKQD